MRSQIVHYKTEYVFSTVGTFLFILFFYFSLVILTFAKNCVVNTHFAFRISFPKLKERYGQKYPLGSQECICFCTPLTQNQLTWWSRLSAPWRPRTERFSGLWSLSSLGRHMHAVSMIWIIFIFFKTQISLFFFLTFERYLYIYLYGVCMFWCFLHLFLLVYPVSSHPLSPKEKKYRRNIN